MVSLCSVSDPISVANMVWNGTQLCVICPYFFEEEGVTVIMNSERYVATLRNFLQLRMEEIVEEGELGGVWFQQDGAATHTARNLMNVLGEIFPGRLVSLRGDVGWPARSPDLSMCDLFLWGYLFKHRPHALPELKERIIEEVNAIPREMCERAVQSFRDRLQQCVAANGRQLEDIIFKSE
jgi:hypothetical protein